MLHLVVLYNAVSIYSETDTVNLRKSHGWSHRRTVTHPNKVRRFGIGHRCSEVITIYALTNKLTDKREIETVTKLIGKNIGKKVQVMARVRSDK
jgi:hypothetical protein